MNKVEFYKTYLPQIFHNDFALSHLQIMDIFDIHQRPCVISLPRGGGNTSLVIGEILYRLHMRENEFIVCFHEKQSYANQFMSTLIRISHSLSSLTSTLRETKSELYLENGNVVWSRGWRQGIQSCYSSHTRPTLIIGCDLHIRSRSETLLRKLYDMIYMDWMPALNPLEYGGGGIMCIGSFNTLMRRLSEDHMASTYTYPALRGEYGKYLRYLDKYYWEFGNNYEFLSDTSDMFTDMDSYWPERYTVSDLMKLYIMLGRDVFEREYLHR